jgi:hypothetical protein
MAGPAAMSTARAILVVVPTPSRDTRLVRAGAFSGSVPLGIVRWRRRLRLGDGAMPEQQSAPLLRSIRCEHFCG